MRLGEIVDLDWRQVDLEALDHEGRAVGEIRLTAATKTSRARDVGLEVSPALRRLLATMKLRSGGTGSVFGLTRAAVQAAELRLRRDYGAPAGCGWQALRRTCGTFLTNAPGIYGSASAYRSARQLGHSVTVAEKHYLGLVRGIPLEARTLENAMQIETQLAAVVEAVGARPAAVGRKLAG
jgi:integrase